MICDFPRSEVLRRDSKEASDPTSDSGVMRSSAPRGDPFWDARAPFYIRKATAAIRPCSEDGNRRLFAFPPGDGGGKAKPGQELANLEHRLLLNLSLECHIFPERLHVSPCG